MQQEGGRFELEQFNGLIPIVVGVTGHRDIGFEQIAAVEASVTAELKKLKNRYAGSPFVLLSGLAEGGDRIAARCALALGIPVVGVLALPQAEFEQDFPQQDLISEFRGLLGRCAFVREAAPSGTPRPDCYVAAGDWIVQQCHLLIAIWDGIDSDKAGGTCMVKNVCLKGETREYLRSPIPNMPDTNPVIHIQCVRAGSSGADGIDTTGSLTVIWRWPEPIELGAGRPGRANSEKERWRAIFSHINKFNIDAKRILEGGSQGIAQNRLNYLNGGNEIDSSQTGSEAIRASWLFAVSDYLAGTAQTLRDRCFIWMIGFSLAAVFFEQLYSGPDEKPGWLALALAFVLIAVAPVVSRRVFRRLESTHVQADCPGARGYQRVISSIRDWIDAEDKYLDCRALAEACRVQYFWKKAGLSECVADFHLVDQCDELEWIRQAMRTTELVPNSPSIQLCAADFVEIEKLWINDQREYFIDSKEKKGGKSYFHSAEESKWSRAAWGLLIATLITMLVALGLEFAGLAYWANWCQLVYGMFLAGSAACNVYQRVQGHADHAKSYRRMGLTMSIAQRKLERHIDKMPNGEEAIRHALDVLLETGIDALDENADWLLLHRDRPVGPTLGS